MSDRKVKRLTPNSIANLVMADEAWHDSLYVKAEDYDSLLADFEALRTALAAEPTKQEPVAWVQKWAIDRLTGQMGAVSDPVTWGIDAPLFTCAVHHSVPLYTAPPDAPTVKESLTHPGYVIGNHWFETAYERLCAGEAEDAILEDYELVREPRLRDLRRDAKRWRHWRDSHGFATIDHEKGRCFVTLICDCDDPDQVRAKRFAGEDLFEWLDAFTDAAMEASTAPASAAADASTAPEAKP